MPPMSEATTNHFEGSGEEVWGDASIELTPPPEQGCHCHCQGGCNCGCSSCLSRIDFVLDEGNQSVYPGQGGSVDIVPSQPVNIPDPQDYKEQGDSYEELIGLLNNSFEAATLSASLPLTGHNLERLAHATNTSEARQSVLTSGWLGGAHNEAHVLTSLDPGMEHEMPPCDFADDMSIDESIIVEPGQRSLAMSMISDFSHSLTRSSPSASIYLSGMRTSYIHTPLPLVAECTHAPNNRRCGCYCRM